MSGLFSTLNSSVQALTAQSRALEISGKNLANVNNPSYSRERVQFGDLGTVQTPQGAESMGVTAVSVEQLRDALLDKQVVSESALSSYYTTLQSAYQNAQASLGQTVSSTTTAGSSSTTDSGIGAALDDVFNAFQSFAASPTDTGVRQALIQATSVLADRLNQTDSRLAQDQSDLNTQISTDVTTTNGLLQQVADLNSQIGRYEVGNPGSAVDLRDQRQAVLEQLATKMPITSTEGADGEVQVSSQDASGNPVVLVNLTSVTGPVTFNGTSFSAGSPATTLALNAGSMQGALDARDGAIQTLRDNLDQLASQLVTSVNAAYNPTGTTGNFFDASGTTAATFQIDPTVTAANLKASDGGAAGDNTVAQAVAQLASQKFSTGSGDQIDGTFANFYAASVGSLGQSLSTVNSQVTNQSSVEQLVRTQRDSVSGVSLDEELANLQMYQRAFQASSRVFTVVDDLLDNVVNTMGK
jgi:flagellar hook-associated protein 1 FlgK